MSVSRGNLFAEAEPPSEGERFEILLQHPHGRIERIISSSRITPTAYVQAEDEWVVLLRGEAELDIDGEVHRLSAGDYVFLPCGLPHVVRKTSDGALWLAVHCEATDSKACG